MALTIKYFARLRDTLGVGSETLPWSEELRTVEDVRAHPLGAGGAVGRDARPRRHPLRAQLADRRVERSNRRRRRDRLLPPSDRRVSDEYADPRDDSRPAGAVRPGG